MPPSIHRISFPQVQNNPSLHQWKPVKPYQKYIPDEAGLQSLNNRFAETPKLTDLDKYI